MNTRSVCPLSTLKDQYEIVRDSDRVITMFGRPSA